ncbi:molecular chaperone HscA [Rhodococcus sp. 27YEA15]|uniref:Hsp70 family protein n=1 Tax=Rhodococcus sp. 27YEA15 TaxID=3156259 RepID=UPI003C7C95DF
MAAGLGISMGSTELVAVTACSVADTRSPIRLPSAWPSVDDPAVVTEFVDRIGDPVPILAVDGSEHHAADLAAALVSALVDRARDVEPLDAVVLAHPVGWNRHTVLAMKAALMAAGVDDAHLVTEPEAIMAWLHASESVAGDGDGDGLTVIYDLGARSLDVTVMSTAAGGHEVLGKSIRSEDIGGDEFDHLVTVHLLDAISDHVDGLDPFEPRTVAALESLRERARIAKEELSVETETVVRVQIPGVDSNVRLVRSELEDLFRPSLTESVALVEETLRTVGVESGDVDRVVLVGGSSAIPLVAEMLSTQLRVPVTADVDPASRAASGAATTAVAIASASSSTSAGLGAATRTQTPVPTFSTPLPVELTELADAPVSARRRSSKVGVVSAVVGAFVVLAAGAFGIGTAMDEITVPSSSANTTGESTPSSRDSGNVGIANTSNDAEGSSTTSIVSIPGDGGSDRHTGDPRTGDTVPGDQTVRSVSATDVAVVPAAAPVGGPAAATGAPVPGTPNAPAPGTAPGPAPAPAPAPAPGPAPAPAPGAGAGIGTGIGNAATGIGNGVGGLVDGLGNGVGGVIGGLGNVVGGVVGGVTGQTR